MNQLTVEMTTRIINKLPDDFKRQPFSASNANGKEEDLYIQCSEIHGESQGHRKQREQGCGHRDGCEGDDPI